MLELLFKIIRFSPFIFWRCRPFLFFFLFHRLSVYAPEYTSTGKKYMFVDKYTQYIRYKKKRIDSCQKNGREEKFVGGKMGVRIEK